MSSPIERMIDAVMVCATCGTQGLTCDCWRRPAPDPRLPQVIDSYASQIAREVIAHIDTMYPGMWVGVPKTARRSVRHTVADRVARVLREILLP